MRLRSWLPLLFCLVPSKFCGRSRFHDLDLFVLPDRGFELFRVARTADAEIALGVPVVLENGRAAESGVKTARVLDASAADRSDPRIARRRSDNRVAGGREMRGAKQIRR